MDFCRSVRKSRKEKVRNGTIREIMEVGKNILEATEEKRLRWFGHVKRMPRNRHAIAIIQVQTVSEDVFALTNYPHKCSQY
jgi:hypothetical protein